MVDRHMRVREVFDAASDRPTEQRATFVHAACAGDSSLSEKLKACLPRIRQAHSGLEPNETMQPETARSSRAYSVLNTYPDPIESSRSLERGAWRTSSLESGRSAKFNSSLQSRFIVLRLCTPGEDDGTLRTGARNSRRS